MTIVLNVFDVGGDYCASIDFTPNGNRQKRNLIFSKEVTYTAGEDPNPVLERLISEVEAEAASRGIEPGAIQNLESIKKIQSVGQSESEDDEAA